MTSEYNNNDTTVTDQTISPPVDGVVATYPLSSSTFWLTQQVPALTPTATSTPPQTTTLSPPSGQNYVSDVSVSAYMRAVNIDLVAYNMRPNRRVYVFFDGKDVTKLIQQPNSIKVDNGQNFTGIIPAPINSGLTNVDSNTGAILGPVDTSREVIDIGGGQARVLYTTLDTDGNRILHVSEIVQPNASIDWTNNTISVYSTKTGATANVIAANQATGFIRTTARYRGYANDAPIFFKEDNERWYKLDLPFRMANTSLTGKTITLVNGPHPGETAQILDHVISNNEVYVSRDFTDFTSTANIIFSIDNVDPTVNPENIISTLEGDIFYDPGTPDQVQTTGRNSSYLYTDENGVFAGTLRIPDPNLVPEYRFRAGEKLIRISDSPTNKPEDATTIAEYVFVAYGLNLSTSQIIINTPTSSSPLSLPAPGVIQEIGSETGNNALPPVVIPSQTPLTVESYNPLAQSFFVSAREYPNGFFTPYIDLFFSNKGTLPIEVQIRPMINGFPDASRVLPNAISYMDAKDVKVTENPDPNDPTSYTRFAFVSPVFLQPDQEYAIVVKTNDFDYDLYVSELGQTILGTNRIVSEQPYTGVLFKSQNASTYTEIQDEDLMFVIHKCQFANSGTVIFTEQKDPTYRGPLNNGRFSSNTMVDAFEVHSDSVQVTGTTINYSYRATSNSTKLLDTFYTDFKADRKTPVTERKVIYGKDISEQSFVMRMDLSTSSPDVSPIIYKNKQSVAALETVINNLGLDQYRVVVANTGNGYTTQNTSISFSANTGFGANAVAMIKIEPAMTGKIISLGFDSNGFGYYDDVNVSISSTDANASGAIINILSETGKAGGPAQARYISKTVTLSPQFDAGDLRVYLTAIRPRQADIQVYYKVKNNFDDQDISEKNWVRMTKVQGIYEYSNALEPIEMEFRPSLTSNTIIYSTDTATFNTFNQFKIKIVMASSSTLLNEIPYVYDMRAIALPGDV